MRKPVKVFITIFLLSVFITTQVSAADSTDTEIGNLIKPLQEKLAAMTSKEIEKNVAQFKDMEKHSNRNQVGKLVGLEIISDASQYNPDKPIQADHFIKMLIRAMGFKVVNNASNWFKPYADLAKKYGLVKTGEISDFTKPISRELATKILVRAVLLVEAAPDSKYDEYIIGKLKDYSKITDSCKQSVIDACKLGLLNGSNPKSNLTRAEAAVVVLRFLDKKERTPMKPRAGEVLKIQSPLMEWIEIYPGTIPETFNITKALITNIPMAKGYVPVCYNSNGIVFADFYESEASWKADCINSIGSIEIDYKHQNKYVFTLGVNDSAKYKTMFADYVREILKVMYITAEGKAKAIALHDKYMNAKYIRTDGLNDYTETTIENRLSLFLRYNEAQFGMQLKLIGEK